MIDILPFLILTAIGGLMVIIWILWYEHGRPSDLAAKPFFADNIIRYNRDAYYYNVLKSVSPNYKGNMLYKKNPEYRQYSKVFNGRKLKPNFKVEE